MSLDMSGHIDDVFASIPATQITYTGGGYDADGIWQDGTESRKIYTVNIQPLNAREIDSLSIGGERINDYRKLYVNNSDFNAFVPNSKWEFNANNNGNELYKTISSDDRSWRVAAKIIVCLIDGQ